jgi:hypothetical protein
MFLNGVTYTLEELQELTDGQVLDMVYFITETQWPETMKVQMITALLNKTRTN